MILFLILDFLISFFLVFSVRILRTNSFKERFENISYKIVYDDIQSKVEEKTYVIWDKLNTGEGGMLNFLKKIF